MYILVLLLWKYANATYSSGSFYHTNSGNDRGSLLGSATKIFTGRAAKAIFATPSSLKIRWAGQTCLGQISSGTGVLCVCILNPFSMENISINCWMSWAEWNVVPTSKTVSISASIYYWRCRWELGLEGCRRQRKCFRNFTRNRDERKWL